MPSPESVLPPKPVTAITSTQQRQWAADGSHAEAAVLDLLGVLQACGIRSWQQLPLDASTAGGAGLAALASCCNTEADAGLLATPSSAVHAVQVRCADCVDLHHVAQQPNIHDLHICQGLMKLCLVLWPPDRGKLERSNSEFGGAGFRVVCMIAVLFTACS
jgi:hypothetical protein